MRAGSPEDAVSLSKSRVSTQKNSETSGFQAWIVWGIASVFYLYEMILRVSPGVMTQELIQDFGVTSTALGVLSSFYYYAYVPLQIPCGLFVDKLGPRKIITLSAFICVLGTFLFAESHSLITAQIGRFLIGAGSSCAFISCLKITAVWFSPAKFALLAGLSNMMGTLGATFGGRPLAMMVNSFGWRQAVLMTALLGIPVVLISWFWIKDKPAVAEEKNSHQKNKSSLSMKESLKIIVQNKQIWLAGIVGGFMYLPISAFTELWAVPFLMNSYNITNELAATASIMLTIGVALGSLVTAWVTEYLESYVKVMRLAALLAGLLFIAIAFAEYFSLWLMFILLFLAGLMIGGQVLCFTCAKDNSTHEVSGTTVAFTNALVMLSGVFFQPILGLILDLVWDGQLSGTGLRVYSNTCYQVSILAVPACLILSWFLLRFLRDTYTQDHLIEDKQKGP
ncbi:MAG: MFS transporter [Alphaproteobacteria bacterium]|nr:MFS transporter [Alphaproteobacteria bacterium]